MIYFTLRPTKNVKIAFNLEMKNVIFVIDADKSLLKEDLLNCSSCVLLKVNACIAFLFNSLSVEMLPKIKSMGATVRWLFWLLFE